MELTRPKEVQPTAASVDSYQLFLNKQDAIRLAKYAEKKVYATDYILNTIDLSKYRNPSQKRKNLEDTKRFWSNIFNKLSSLIE